MKRNLITSTSVKPLKSRIVDSLPIIGIQHLVLDSNSKMSTKLEYFMFDEKWIKSSIEDMEYENLILFIDLVNARAMGLKDLSWNIENEDYRFGMFLKYHYRESFINSYFNTCKDAGSIRGLFSVSGTAKAILKPCKPFTSLDGPSICQQ